MEKDTYIPQPTEAGNDLLADLIFSGGSDHMTLLHALLKLVGLPAAKLAKMTGLTRGRITHYLRYDEPVPEPRQEQFYIILRGVIEEWEKTLALVDADPTEFEPALSPNAVPIARATVKACRKILAAEKKRLPGAV